MNVPMLLAGILFVLGVGYDIVQTALRLGQGGGPLTLHLASRLWRLALRFPRILQASGVLILLVIVFVWVLSSWVGWSLIFAASDASVVATATGFPADLVGKIYFAGYTIFTLGNGDYKPVGAWQLATVVASVNGLMVVTLSITYLVPLLSAVVERRALAERISLLGGTIEEVVAKLASTNVDAVRTEVEVFPQFLLLLKERHLAYPVMHYFQSRDRDAATAVNLAVLNEALLLVCEGAIQPDPALVAAGANFRTAVARLVTTLEPWFVTQQPAVPDVPAIELLHTTGWQLRDPEDFRHRVAPANDLRRQLSWMVLDTGWSWRDDVASGRVVGSP